MASVCSPNVFINYFATPTINLTSTGVWHPHEFIILGGVVKSFAHASCMINTWPRVSILQLI